ncbi:MAG: imidazoleglycerol-phosphate dehydratase HisB [Dissulfurimicrobium sp.]|uniref:imidazoleglycerol-phosphate dehydratase HisB n=1 Tax=Dissulfurimicrobium TaxID=1769732 RepID=UPI001EDB9FA0|nr:imidazoleglycerol-phosphate dehydratase HisB [Dissulfurimicrobium hydrothermale]UKL13328.1 imidazoleglycerol-phosphate dehydratase HisB [Dissulfurimicrobium hydrothermale]
MSRTSKIKRKTSETEISLGLVLDGSGKTSVKTGIGFFDHMLTLWAVHGFFDLDLAAKGDLDVDFHHTVEDIGICLGKAIADAIGDMKGIKRYGGASVPMDEALARVDVDVCGRPFLVFDAKLSTAKIGGFDAELIEEFLRAVAINSGITLHVHVPYGKNNHHIAEAIFKAFARALDKALQLEPRLCGRPLSSKGGFNVGSQ